jgi:acetyltransferase-like isoleucine patch superfamily enzyme
MIKNFIRLWFCRFVCGYRNIGANVTFNHSNFGVGLLKSNTKNKPGIATDVTIDLTSDLMVGDNVEISRGVTILTHKHHWEHSKGLRKDIQIITTAPMVIEDDAFIGINAIILGIKRIGKGAIIGAGSVVTHDVPDFEIWAGNPARKIRDRREVM